MHRQTNTRGKETPRNNPKTLVGPRSSENSNSIDEAPSSDCEEFDLMKHLLMQVTLNQNEPGITKRDVDEPIGTRRMEWVKQKPMAEAIAKESVPSVLQDFYGRLVLLHSLGRTQGERIGPSKAHRLSETPDQWRRAFLNDLASMCDFKKGGSTVTAIALEQTPKNHIFWIASNTNPAKLGAPFLRNLLSKLANVSADPVQLERDIREEGIKLARQRIKVYLGFIDRQKRELARRAKEWSEGRAQIGNGKRRTSP